jgi:RNA exonuclease 1
MTIEHPLYPSCYVFPSYEEGWLITKRSKKSKSMKSTSMIAVDCEMVLCEDGTEAVVKVCVVDRNLEVKLNELVKPNKAVADYRTSITGVSAEDLEGATCSLTYIQKSIKNLLRYGTILVGHSLNNDLQALKIDHGRVIDTSFVFKIGYGSTLRRPSLSDLCKSVLGFELRKKGKPHNCLDDARAAMKLALAKIKGGDENNTLPAPLIKDMPEVYMTKLLIHNISSSMPMEELHNIVPGDFTMEMGDKKAGGSKYKVVALFKNEEEANQAFEDVQGNEEKDQLGRPQKLVSYKLATGASSNLYVRKMGDGTQISSKKRSHENEEDNSSVKSKKSKTETESNECDSHVKEIERLKQELKERDQEISSLNKIIAALARKQGL